MIKSLLLISVCSMLSGACQLRYSDNPHTLLDVAVNEEATDRFLAVAAGTAQTHGLTVVRGEFPEARHHIHALRLEGRDFSVSITNPHRAQDFILATYLVVDAGNRATDSERRFVSEVSAKVASEYLGHTSPRPDVP